VGSFELREKIQREYRSLYDAVYISVKIFQMNALPPNITVIWLLAINSSVWGSLPEFSLRQASYGFVGKGVSSLTRIVCRPRLKK
jgi:hypothetical protein